MCNIHTKELNNKENTAKIRNNLRSYLHLTKTGTKRNIERKRKREKFSKRVSQITISYPNPP